MLLSEDNHPGYTRIDASMARPGDIVVQGSHAGVYAAGGKEGLSGAPKAYANGGRPATSRKGYYDGKTHKVSMTRKDYGDHGPVYLRPIVEK
jgi:hypothetical protein